MKQFIAKKIFALFGLVCLLIIITFSCQKEKIDQVNSDTTQTTTIVDQPAESTSNNTDSTSSDQVNFRTHASWDLNLANFRYVWQNRRPNGWTSNSNYGTYSNSCNYPKYNGAYQFTEGSNTNLCGIASYMMGVHLVSHPALMDVPYGVNDRAIRMVEYAKRYKTFDASYAFGAYCNLSLIANMGKGLTNKKGDFTNWSQCSSYTSTGTSWGGTTNRDAAKSFIQSKISSGKPCVALIRVRTTYTDANNTNYVTTNSNLGTGHMVLIVGLTINDDQGIYKVRFKDPWSNNNATYEISYTKFLDSMVAASSNGVYNVMSVNGN